MASYSIAAGQERLPDLIDRALAGEEVIITREGGSAVELRVVRSPSAAPSRMSNSEGLEMLRALRESVPTAKTSYLELKRVEEEERGY